MKKTTFTGLHSGAIGQEILSLLKTQGVLSQQTICRSLNVSQPTFSRAVQALIPDQVVRLGNSKNTVYAARRVVLDVGARITVVLVNAEGQVRAKGELQAIFPGGFVWIPEGTTRATTHKDLPYFLSDLRPQGFLGRIVPGLHPELGYPPDIRNWSGDHTLGYLVRHGTDCMGQVIVGENALSLYEQSKAAAKSGISYSARATAYPILASQILEKGSPGSSAGGEQPKFTCYVETSRQVTRSVIVKFSQSISESGGRRVGDLLVCEALAHGVLEEAGVSASKSTIIETKKQVFLEVERFDRTSRGRRGVISLDALNLEYAANLGGWTDVVVELAGRKVLSKDCLQNVLRLDLFGELIANSDRHNGNLSFYFDDFVVGGLTPVYDMLPMLYMPQQGQILDRVFAPRPPKVSQLTHWAWARECAMEFWGRAEKDGRISKSFQRIARENRAIVEKMNY